MIIELESIQPTSSINSGEHGVLERKQQTEAIADRLHKQRSVNNGQLITDNRQLITA